MKHQHIQHNLVFLIEKKKINEVLSKKREESSAIYSSISVLNPCPLLFLAIYLAEEATIWATGARCRNLRLCSIPLRKYGLWRSEGGRTRGYREAVASSDPNT